MKFSDFMILIIYTGPSFNPFADRVRRPQTAPHAPASGPGTSARGDEGARNKRPGREDTGPSPGAADRPRGLTGEGDGALTRPALIPTGEGRLGKERGAEGVRADGGGEVGDDADPGVSGERAGKTVPTKRDPLDVRRSGVLVERRGVVENAFARIGHNRTVFRFHAKADARLAGLFQRRDLHAAPARYGVGPEGLGMYGGHAGRTGPVPVEGREWDEAEEQAEGRQRDPGPEDPAPRQPAEHYARPGQKGESIEMSVCRPGQTVKTVKSDRVP